MRFHVSRATIAPRCQKMARSLPRPACWCALAVGLLVLSVGCKGGGKHSVSHTEVTGKVTYNGQGLPGGRIVFAAVNGGFTATGDIDEKGDYTINAPVGEVQISIDNTGLLTKADAPHPKRPGAEEPKPLRGRFVRIPDKYRDVSLSGLKYTVKPGSAPQTFDITLTD